MFLFAGWLMPANGAEFKRAVKDTEGNPVPADLLTAYQKFVGTTRNGDVGDIVALALPSSLAWSLAPRDPAKEDTGPDVNMPFIKKGFRSEISLVRKERKDCYLIRTVTTALWYIKGADSHWWIYKYLDKPIE